MNKWIAEFDLEDGDTMPEHMDLEYEGVKLDFHCRPMWIPVSERLPKTDNWRTTFNVTTKQGKVMSMEWENATVRGKSVSRWVWIDRISPWEVIAWMPLPEPYKARSKENVKKC